MRHSVRRDVETAAVRAELPGGRRLARWHGRWRCRFFLFFISARDPIRLASCRSIGGSRNRCSRPIKGSSGFCPSLATILCLGRVLLRALVLFSPRWTDFFNPMYDLRWGVSILFEYLIGSYFWKKFSDTDFLDSLFGLFERSSQEPHP